MKKQYIIALIIAIAIWYFFIRKTSSVVNNNITANAPVPIIDGTSKIVYGPITNPDLASGAN